LNEHESLSSYIQHVADHFHVPSVSIGIVGGNGTPPRCEDTRILTTLLPGADKTQTYDHAVLPDIPADQDTLYYIGSTTKAFTVLSLLRVFDELSSDTRPLTLDTPLRVFLAEDFVLPDAYATAQCNY
jgi:hypothetical protein